ncbi:SAM-dependent chlorinase/fluorinase [Limnothrix sp. FACHB-881]|uniref:SAM hydrolase/SAM-dependent halogenase family protein n=1 Tax=Limnothrix sp. FACHB-881 TaxID=2692819 RepID=UPI0016866F0E|nr:SAM-dependent chlorinase/fluorinase [Limnothrix sp. FACHB-881]MBD2636462.1 SAM-dependent chlorinase/fluorinase [Limnothrix sp. FACHB-881]
MDFSSTAPLTAWLAPPRPIALLTDFGTADGYAGVLKGVIAQVNPAIPTIDLTHQIPPQDLWAARFVLANSAAAFPLGTVFLAVVDPGVGGERRPIAIAFDRGWLVGPDNGLWSGLLAQFPAESAVVLTQRNFWRLPNPSHTFHGRDIFAAVAAHLANGVPLADLGNPIDPASLVNLPLPGLVSHPAAGANPASLEGVVQHVDHFGNLISTIPAQRVSDRSWRVRIGEQLIPSQLTYSSRSLHDFVALVGSHDWVEVACAGGNAAQRLNLNRGDRILVEFLN